MESATVEDATLPARPARPLLRPPRDCPPRVDFAPGVSIGESFKAGWDLQFRTPLARVLATSGDGESALSLMGLIVPGRTGEG